MLIAGVLCLCVAVAAAALGLWSVSRPATGDIAAALMRAVAPPQLAAAVMLASGGAVALGAPHRAPVVVILCVIGAVSTVAAGAWQAARHALNGLAAQTNCVGNCAGCAVLDCAGPPGS
jgi:hypothetical protein